MPDKLLYEARTELVPWTKKDDDHKALHFIIAGRNFDRFLCQGDADDLEFWQAVGWLWECAPLMQLRLKEARDAIASLPSDALGIASAPDFLGDRTGEGVDYDTTHWYIRDELLSNIERALREEKGE